nr:hypothetical protein [Tanacetum cinerariifolium]
MVAVGKTMGVIGMIMTFLVATSVGGSASCCKTGDVANMTTFANVIFGCKAAVGKGPKDEVVGNSSGTAHVKDPLGHEGMTVEIESALEGRSQWWQMYNSSPAARKASASSAALSPPPSSMELKLSQQPPP